MSKLCRVPSIITLICFAYALAAAAAPARTALSVKFPTVDSGFVVVPVTINGAGPFRFLLDTGSNSTVLEPRLAAQLALPHVGQDIVSGFQADMRVSIVHAKSISMAGATLDNLDLVVCSQLCPLPDDTRGILGEDFLAHFDLLLDYHNHRVELESTAGELLNQLEGERLPVIMNGVIEGQPSGSRLIVTGEAFELGKRPVFLLLDSGTNSLVIFGDLGAGTQRQDIATVSISGTSGYDSLHTRMIRMLRLGGKTIYNVLATAPAKSHAADTDGLMPLSAFQSIFISHRGRFVILNPSFPKGVRDGQRLEARNE